MLNQGVRPNSVNNYILICDDVEDNCIFFQTILEMEGYTVEFVTSGIEALNKIKSQKPDLLLLDIMMPEINGYEVVRRVQKDKHLQTLPILLITAHQEVFAMELSDISVNGIIQKPVDPDDLVERIQEIFEAVD
ncbi:MAG: response regulator [Mojavia pulchra JT2-VF2]|jgi:CheY-like chemotaxis protein|uniref:Response regulator n=1 Tax=Mojavia pulchra JT2-VF2 TaxID=287848 RepID=A0A951Q1Z8_9NOST|nr:response regulator [Mojavia pulchra JT2-VF2]